MRLEKHISYAFYLYPELDRETVVEYIQNLVGHRDGMGYVYALRPEICEGLLISWSEYAQTFKVYWIAIGEYHNGHLEKDWSPVEHVDLRNKQEIRWRRHSMV